MNENQFIHSKRSLLQEDGVKETRERLTWLKEHTTPDCSKGFARFNIKNIESILAEIDRLQTKLQEKDCVLSNYKQLEAESQEYRKVLKDAGESVCSLQCPSTWKTGSEPPHSELCKRIREILK